MLSSRAGGDAGNAGSGATGTGTADAAVGSAATQLQGADPAYGLKQLMQIKKDLAAMITQYAFRVPGAARALSSCLKGLDSGIKEMQTAQSTMQAVNGPGGGAPGGASGGPIALSAIPQPSPPGALGASPPQGSSSGM